MAARRVLPRPTIPPADSDEEYDPLNTSKSNFNFNLLDISSDTDELAKEEVLSSEEEDIETDKGRAEAPAAGPSNTRNNRKNRKKAEKRKYQHVELSASEEEGIESDEDVVIAPVPGPSDTKCNKQQNRKNSQKSEHQDADSDSMSSEQENDNDESISVVKSNRYLLKVDYKKLDPNREFTKRFGRDEDDPHSFRKRQTLKDIILIVPKANISIGGLSMSIVFRGDDVVHFAFDHSEMYRKMLFRYLTRQNEAFSNLYNLESLLDRADNIANVDPENIDLIEYNLKTVIACYLDNTHKQFGITDPKVRLPYTYLENRPLLVAMLKYAYMLSLRACHRTALEVCKVLLNLDPNDALAVILAVNVFAMRGREHQWLLDFVDEWKDYRKLDEFFFFKYSCALAQYHIDKKNKAGFKKSDEMIKKAFEDNLFVLITIFKLISFPLQISHLKTHSILSNSNLSAFSQLGKHFIEMYANLTKGIWLEYKVSHWLARNFSDFVKKYDSDDNYGNYIKKMISSRSIASRHLPSALLKHMSVLKYLRRVLFDSTKIERESALQFMAFNPEWMTMSAEEETIDRYGYMTSFTRR